MMAEQYQSSAICCLEMTCGYDLILCKVILSKYFRVKNYFFIILTFIFQGDISDLSLLTIMKFWLSF